MTKKKQRRVSFSLPEKEAEEAEVSHPGVRVSVSDDFDEEVETVGDDASADSDSSNGSREKGEVVGGSEDETDDSSVEEEAAESDEIEDDDKGSESEGKDDGSDGSEDESDDESEDEERGGDSEDAASKGEKAPAPVGTFSEMKLDPRVERAIERMGWRKPTPIQSSVIPAALAGRDVLVSAPTGSGKTAAYAVPIVQQVCRMPPSERSGVRAVVLVPTRELVHQVASVLKGLCKYVDGLHVASVTGKDGKRKKPGVSFSMVADILVGTPSSITAAAGIEEKNALSQVRFVVVDEADLVLSYGYERDARAALARIPPTAQSMLLSATLEADGMDSFRKVILRRPLTIKVMADSDVQDGDPTGATHYFARLKNTKDRYLVTYAMLRLNVICGKVLIFVNHINSAFRLKLFLDQFKLKSAVLNSELPANSRIHCVEQFNAGVFDILIATDESRREDNGGRKETAGPKSTSKKRKRVERDEEFGLSRGVDFRDVAAVFNFDIPNALQSYTHRAGRTARAGKSGTVLSLVCSGKEEHDITEVGKELGVHIGPLAFRMDQIEAFRYRVESSLRLVTDSAVHGARLADVRREIVNSKTLTDYFEDNPQDLDALQHNLNLAKRIPEHLGHIPSYLLPPALRGTVANDPKGPRFKTSRRRGPGYRVTAEQKKRGDPLQSFSARGLSGSSRQRYRAARGIRKKTKDMGRTGLTTRKRKRTF